MGSIEMIVLAFVLFTAFSIALTTAIYGIGPMPSSSAAKKTIRGLLPPEAKTICVLGSGWGTLAIDAARERPEANVIGIEISPIPWLFSLLKSKLSQQRNLTLQWGNFYTIDLKAYDVVICYLFPGGMRRLKPKLIAELPNGAHVISNTFALAEIQPTTVSKLNDSWKSHIYLYRL